MAGGAVAERIRCHHVILRSDVVAVFAHLWHDEARWPCGSQLSPIEFVLNNRDRVVRVQG